MTLGIVVLDPATLSFSKECYQQKEEQENKFGQEEGWRQVWRTSLVPMWELVYQVILDLLKHSGKKAVPVGVAWLYLEQAVKPVWGYEGSLLVSGGPFGSPKW